MILVENKSKEALMEIKRIIGEAFVTNELFHEFGSIEERHDLVLRYMDIYVQCVYESKALYQTEDGNAFLGIAYSDQQPLLPKLKMMAGLFTRLPFSKLKALMKHVKDISNGNREYTRFPYTEILMVCVRKESQHQGYTRELVSFAKKMASNRQLPLLFDTDMESYAKIYQHYGCELYHTVTAYNGVTRYNLVWKDF